jgi:Fibronectin type III domain
MPTISQLPAVTQVTSADEVPLSQAGVTRSVSVGTLLANTQPAIFNESGTLLGRTSLGVGGPEAIVVGIGLVLNAGTLATSGEESADLPQQTALVLTDQAVLNSAGNPMLLPLSLLRGLFSAGSNISISPAGTISANASTPGQSGSYSITSLTPVTTIATSDLVAISQSGVDHTISYADFLDGLTIDLAQPALAVAATDTLWVAQGSSTMLRQTFAAVWSWVMSQMPSYKLPVVELTTNTTLDGTIHNGRVLICSQPITLSPAALNMGSGFYCDVLNLSAGNVTLGTGITSSSGSSSLPSGQAASLRCISYSAGTVVLASLPGSGSSGGTAPAVPGQVISLTTGSPTSTSIALSWSTPASGGAVGTYTIAYRITGTTSWSVSAPGITATNASVTGLAAATAYDFQVYAVNAGGTGLPSAVANATTTAVAGAVASITWQTAPSGSVPHGSGTLGVNAHVNPGTAPIQFGFSTSLTVRPTSWVAASYINSDFWGVYIATPASAGTWYAWAEGTDGSAPTVYPVPFTVT